MSIRVTTLALALAACSPRAATAPAPEPPPEDVQPMPDPETWRTMPPNPDCATTFAELLAGDLSGWHGISGCTRRDAEDAFGPSEVFSGVLGPGRRHVPDGTAPMGVHVSYQGDEISAAAFQAKWTAEHLAPLGPPDDERPSGLGPEHNQLAWAERGLIVHTSMFEGAPWLVVGFVPMPLEALRTSSIFNLQLHERVVLP